MKVGWKLVTNRDALWARVVRDKYRCGNDLLPIINKYRCGNDLWSGIKQTWDKVKDGISIDSITGNPKWKWERNGNFSVNSAYAVISKEDDQNSPVWECIWKVKAPQKCKAF